MSKEDCLDRPIAEFEEFLFHPISETKYQVFRELYFIREEGHNVPETDSWWVIILWHNEQEKYVIDFGWRIN